MGPMIDHSKTLTIEQVAELSNAQDVARSDAAAQPGFGARCGGRNTYPCCSLGNPPAIKGHSEFLAADAQDCIRRGSPETRPRQHGFRHGGILPWHAGAAARDRVLVPAG